MAAIGFVAGSIEKGFVGQLKTLSIRAAIEIRPNPSKAGDVQPDYRVWSEGVEIGAGWVRIIAKGYASQRWLTYRQAEAAGGNVRRGEKGSRAQTLHVRRA